MAEYDYVVIGSGMNSLVCAAMLARKGARIIVLEREEVAGGCIRTGEVTLPGFRHDLMSGFYPEFIAGAAYAELGGSLHAHGLAFENTTRPTGVALPGGRSFVLSTDRASNVRNLNRVSEGDGDRFEADMSDFGASAHISFGLLGNELLSLQTAKLLLSEVRKRGLLGLTDYFGKASRSARTWLQDYKSEEARACFAPWVLHAGMDIDGAMSGYMGRVFAFALEAAGMPVVKGGSENIVKAFVSLLESHAATVRTGEDVVRIRVEKGRAQGVVTRGGKSYSAAKGVVCNVTPDQLYGEGGLLPDEAVPAAIRSNARSYQYGRGNMIIHLALGQEPRWPDPELCKVAMVHVLDGVEQTTRSLAEVRNGYLPKRATIAVGQKAAVDPSRVPPGKSCMWLQLHEVPRELRGDAAGQINTDEGWTTSVREQYADRIIDQLAEFVPGLKADILARNVYSPRDLQLLNINLVGGDPYSGANTLDQFLMWRPLRGLKGHRTPIRNVYHIGASTHPGPGLGGMSGFLVGRQLR